jgi:hypothetical protein
MSREDAEDSGIYIPPIVYSIANLVMTIAFVLAGLGLAYLLYGVFVGLGGFAQWDIAKKNVMLGNIAMASKALTIGLGVGALCAAVLFWFEELAGYIILIAAALLGLGIPFLFPMLGGEKASVGVAKALEAFPVASMAPGAIGFLLVIRDIISKFANAVQRRGAEADTTNLQLGAGAKREQKPLRTSLLGKCWEGNYCRDWVRPHCPIYQKRDACWRQRRGCYCEQDIVSGAASKSQTGGVQLEMAPASQYNYANPSAPGTTAAAKTFLSDAQKVERCRNCVIYNDHQSEKYKIAMPLTIVVMLVVCVLIAPLMRLGISASMSGIEHLAGKLAFTDTQSSTLKLSRPNDTVQWALVGAFSMMIVSKALQIVEWCIFTKKL